jgi:putative ABC transport system permease protein
MMKYIRSRWKRNRERLILMIIGIMVISGGLSYLLNLTESNKGTVVENLQKSWVSSYDIVVKPNNSTGGSLLEPNYLNGITGGISMDQYETIKNIQGVDVAAPISIIGYAELGITYEELFNEELSKGIYRVHVKETGNNGIESENLKDYSFYFSEGAEIKERIPGVLGPGQFDKRISLTQSQLLVGIDPEQEAKLVGLDKAIDPIGNGRYFDSIKDKPNKLEAVNSFEIPVIINSNSFSQTVHNLSLERLNVDFGNENEQQDTMAKILNNGGRDYLDTLPSGELVKSTSLSSKEVENNYFFSITGVTSEGNEESPKPIGEARNSSMIVYKSSPLQYKEVQSPFPERWKHAFSTTKSAITIDDPFHTNIPSAGYRNVALVDPVEERAEGELPILPVVTYNVLGFYNPNNITASMDPLNELPLETYRPTRAKMVLDESAAPINPPKDVIGIGNPAGLLTNPPNIITTLDAAEMITNGKSISSIRIMVNGVDGIGEDSQKRVESIADEISSKTGLKTVITLGSSPQPTITRIQDQTGTLGWIEQPWINIGNAITIFRETSLGYSGVMISMLFVAVVYVFSTSLISFLSRKKEFSILLSLGWEPRHIRSTLMLETVVQWMMVVVISGIIEMFIFLQTYVYSFLNIFYIALFALLVYGLSLIPLTLMVRKITPYQALRTGEISTLGKRLLKTRGILGIVVNNAVSKWRRNILSLLVIAMPTSLFTFYLFVSLRLQGVLYTSWLGEYVALSIDDTHYITLGVAFGLAILTTAEIMWQNISERKSEIGIQQAIGWGRAAIRFIIIMEGAFIGFIAGIAGLAISIAVIVVIYGVFPADSLLLLSLTIVIPVMIGIIGSLLPSEIGVRTKPINAMKA